MNKRVKWLERRDAICPQCGSKCIAEDYIIVISRDKYGYPVYSPITHTRYYCPRCGTYEL